MVLPIGFETMEDPTLQSITMEALLYLQLRQQLIEQQRENIELCKEETL